jgi:hypothetical protein
VINSEPENEHYPIEPRYHPIHKIPRKIYDALASAKLAMAMLVIILACCVVGVTIFRGAEASERIFNSLWFNGLLVILVMNVACCFFGRIWGKRITVISFGMILFHLSFVAVFLGVVYNSLFYFRGDIRLTEGEALANGDPQSYDSIDHGRFFGYTRLRGETSLIKMHAGYKSDGKDKRVAYEVEVGEGNNRKHEIVYITKSLEFNGAKYFRDKEGYSLLVTMSDWNGNELYGAYIPFQSYKQPDGKFRYAIGTKEADSGTMFPLTQDPLFNMQMVYTPSVLTERGGMVEVRVRPFSHEEGGVNNTLLAQTRLPIGEKFSVGNYLLSVKEVRYWVGMRVTYEPGQPVILSSLWVGLFGVTLTTLGRIFRKRKNSSGA